MSTDSFLSIAETRADHLRQLSHHERSLEWVNASLTEVEGEIPELELAMAVYRRLNPGAADAGGSQAAFLSIAGVRADHLRQLSHHMRALNWVSGPVAEIETEIPELERAMSVYRRLMPEDADSGASKSAKARSAAAQARNSRDAEDAEPPSFKEYALQHLDGGDEARDVESVGNSSNSGF